MALNTGRNDLVFFVVSRIDFIALNFFLKDSCQLESVKKWKSSTGVYQMVIAMSFERAIIRTRSPEKQCCNLFGFLEENLLRQI